LENMLQHFVGTGHDPLWADWSVSQGPSAARFKAKKTSANDAIGTFSRSASKQPWNLALNMYIATVSRLDHPKSLEYFFWKSLGQKLKSFFIFIFY